jgi:hypothetical protein
VGTVRALRHGAVHLLGAAPQVDWAAGHLMFSASSSGSSQKPPRALFFFVKSEKHREWVLGTSK